jgi:hypothetical protein
MNLEKICKKCKSFPATEWMLIFPNKGDEVTFYPISDSKMFISVLESFVSEKRQVILMNNNKYYFFDRFELIDQIKEQEFPND